jgi:hypothetical protein
VRQSLINIPLYGRLPCNIKYLYVFGSSIPHSERIRRFTNHLIHGGLPSHCIYKLEMAQALLIRCININT